VLKLRLFRDDRLDKTGLARATGSDETDLSTEDDICRLLEVVNVRLRAFNTALDNLDGDVVKGRPSTCSCVHRSTQIRIAGASSLALPLDTISSLLASHVAPNATSTCSVSGVFAVKPRP
jgi:hypothetical protein